MACIHTPEDIGKSNAECAYDMVCDYANLDESKEAFWQNMADTIAEYKMSDEEFNRAVNAFDKRCYELAERVAKEEYEMLAIESGSRVVITSGKERGFEGVYDRPFRDENGNRVFVVIFHNEEPEDEDDNEDTFVYARSIRAIGKVKRRRKA